jgi:type III pantothenate kinase
MTKDDYILVVDIGNTSTALGLYRRGKVSARARIPSAVQDRRTLRRVVERTIRGRRLAGASLCSVVPTLNRTWASICRTLRIRRVVWINHRIRLGVKVNYPRPRTIGADRLANASGAVARYGAPVVVADFGTAVTFDIITRDRGYVGGIIAPGLPLMFSYLAEKTAQLPRIELGPVRHPVGRSTREAMRLGAWWGYRGMVREILRNVRRHIGPGRVTLCATGGFAGRVLHGFRPALRVDPDLTLFGAGRIFELNR